jgi:hypothetical protein
VIDYSQVQVAARSNVVCSVAEVASSAHFRSVHTERKKLARFRTSNGKQMARFHSRLHFVSFVFSRPVFFLGFIIDCKFVVFVLNASLCV